MILVARKGHCRGMMSAVDHTAIQPQSHRSSATAMANMQDRQARGGITALTRYPQPRSWQHKQSWPPSARAQHPTCGAPSSTDNSHTHSQRAECMCMGAEGPGDDIPE